MRVNLWWGDFILHRPECVLGDRMEHMVKKMRLVASNLKIACVIMKKIRSKGRTRRLL